MSWQRNKKEYLVARTHVSVSNACTKKAKLKVILMQFYTKLSVEIFYRGGPGTGVPWEECLRGMVTAGRFDRG